MTKRLPLLLAALLAASPTTHAFDVLNPDDGWGARKEKPAKAPREKNDGKYLEYLAKSFGAGAGVGAVGVTVIGAAALPVLAVVGGFFIADKMGLAKNAKINAFYSGTVTRGRIMEIEKSPTMKNFGFWSTFTTSSVKVIPQDVYGFDLSTFPSDVSLKTAYEVVHIDVGGPDGATTFAVVKKGNGYRNGDIVDVKSPVGVFALNTKVFDNLNFDFNKHMPRVVNVYCKADNKACQDDYDSSLGVLTRHTDTEFPPSQYLIDPAIIAADQAKMRKEEEEKKAAQHSGGFSFM